MDTRVLRFTGHAYFRQRLVLATLAGRAVRIDRIRPDDEEPGLRNFEASFLRLLEKLTNGSAVEINYTGTSVFYQPGIVYGGTVTHDCGTTRGIGYFLEWIVALAPFAKEELSLTLRGITSGQGDLGADTVRTVINRYIPDIYLFSDVYRGDESGKSPGFSMSLVSTSTTGALHAAEATSAPGRTPEDVGLEAARALLTEIAARGCVDRTHQPLVLLLMALGPEDVAKCRMSALTPAAIQTLRDIRDALGVVFKLRIIEDDEVLVTCVGVGFRGFRTVN